MWPIYLKLALFRFLAELCAFHLMMRHISCKRERCALRYGRPTFPLVPGSGCRHFGERERHRSADIRSLEAAKYSAEKETLGDRIGERMLSRLHEMCRIIEMEGADYRRSLKSASFR